MLRDRLSSHFLQGSAPMCPFGTAQQVLHAVAAELSPIALTEQQTRYAMVVGNAGLLAFRTYLAAHGGIAATGADQGPWEFNMRRGRQEGFTSHVREPLMRLQASRS